MPERATIIDVRLVDGPAEPETFDPFPQPCGAECIFVGRTRLEHHPEHGALVRLSYEAYRPMALKVLEDLATGAAAQFDCRAVRIVHALGPVPPGAGSVVVQVACGHRGASFDACRHLIDALKKAAPIWKREEWADGTTWSEGTPATPTSEPTR
ncbi:MAG: molybdenum cofactor biosynthesis protein MoaE [Phycisphaerales bacterium]|nr:molybdenum cofactor biosynthesis protein MoaE [Phycisphaerales bacterium]